MTSTTDRSTTELTAKKTRVAKRPYLVIPDGAVKAVQQARQASQPTTSHKRRRPVPPPRPVDQQEESDTDMDNSSAQSEERGRRTGQQARAESALVRLFSVTLVRGVSASTVDESMAAAWQEDPELTMAILALTRDCRHGKGEKLVVQHALLWLRQHKPQTYLANLLTFLDLGCFKDLLHLAVAVCDKRLPLLGEHGTVPIELELLAEFMNADRQALAEFKSRQQTQPMQLQDETAAPAKPADKEDEDDDFELVVAPNADKASGAFQPRELDSFEVVPRARLTIDLCFVIDCTGSMGSWIAQVQKSTVQLARQVEAECAASGVAEVCMRFACAAYRDYEDKNRFQLCDFTADVDELVKFVNRLCASGGGDAPEDLVGGLDQALKLSWNDQADARFLILIADAPAHGEQYSSSDSPGSIAHRASHPEPELRDLVQQVHHRNIRLAFTRITAETDVMLEMMQGWYDDRPTRNVLNVLQLGQRVDKLVPLVLAELTAVTLGRMPVIAVEEEKEAEQDLVQPAEATATQQPSAVKRATARLSLAAKWAPTEGSHFDRKPYKFATALANRLFPQSRLTSKRQYRKLCSSLREELCVVERDMCTQQWSRINFSTVPARCHKLLKKAFQKHEPARYAAFLGQVKSGKATIKTSGLQPHEIVEGYRSMLPPMLTDDVAEAQWAAMVQQVRGKLKEPDAVRALAMVDTSGSMTWNMQLGHAYGARGLSNKMDNVAPIDAAMALALIITQLSAPSGLHGHVMTFSDEARWVQLPGADASTLGQRVDALRSGASNGGGTDVVQALTLLLNTAVERGLTDGDMPNTVFILTDLDFRNARGDGMFNLADMRDTYAERGLRLPRIVLWNVAARAASTGVSTHSADPADDDTGPTVLSGYSLPMVGMALEQLDEDTRSAMLEAVAPYTSRVYVDNAEREWVDWVQ